MDNTDPEPPPPTSRLLALPAELRLNIWEYCYTSESDFIIETTNHLKLYRSLLDTCRLTRHEALPAYVEGLEEELRKVRKELARLEDDLKDIRADGAVADSMRYELTCLVTQMRWMARYVAGESKKGHKALEARSEGGEKEKANE